MTRKFERIEGGWRNVPEHMKTKTQLKQMEMVPGGDPIGEVWSHKVWIQLYDVAEAIPKPKRNVSDKQLAALEKARKKAEENRTCVDCKGTFPHKSYLSKWHGDLVCEWCWEKREQEEEERLFQEAAEHFTRVAGPMYDGRQEIIGKMTDETALFLEREPSNRFDENAIKVLALIDNEKQHIGYLHRRFAAKFASIMDSGQEVHIENLGIITEEHDVWDGYERVDGYEISTYKHMSTLGVQIRVFIA